MAVTLDSSIPYKTILVKFGNHPNKDFVWFSTTINAWYEKNMNAAHGYSTTGKITRSTVLNTHRAKEFIVPSTIRRRITRAALFLKMYQVLFQRETSSEAVVIAIVEADPLAKIVSVFLSSALYTLGTYEPENYIIRGIHPYLVSLYCNQFSLWFPYSK